MFKRVTVEILIDVPDEPGQAEDCISETLRPLLRRYEPLSSIVDWRYLDGNFHDDDGNKGWEL